MFGSLLHDSNLWHINRHSVSRAVGIGLFCCFLPIPFQMILAAALAIAIRANIPISVTLVWISNPLTIAPIFYFCYKVGSYLLQLPPAAIEIELSFHWLSTQLGLILQPLILGSLVCGLTVGLVGFLTSRLMWRIWVCKCWAKRRQERLR